MLFGRNYNIAEILQLFDQILNMGASVPARPVSLIEEGEIRNVLERKYFPGPTETFL